MKDFAIHYAVRENNLERVRQLIEAGVSVGSLDEDGRTPLHLAACYDLYEMTALLINSKCDLDIKDRRGLTPLMLAVAWGNKDIVDLLLNSGAQVNCSDDKGWTVLHKPPFISRLDIMRLILDHSEVDLNAVDQVGDTPLVRAVRLGDEDVASLLIRAGADVTTSDIRKMTVLHVAVWYFRKRVFQILLEKERLNLSPQDASGYTPLHFACSIANRWAIKKLLKAGADVNMKNNRGETALSVGIKRGILTYKEIKLFVQKGAFLNNRDYKYISRNPLLKKNVLKDVEICTQSVVNKFNRHSLPALNSITYFSKRLPNVYNFKLGAQHIVEVKNLVKSEIERNTFCNVVKVHPISLSSLCVLSLITCQSGKKLRAAFTGFSHSPF